MNYRLLPIEEVLAEIRFDSDNEDGRDNLVFRQWVFRALRNIGYAKNQRKMSELIPVEDFGFPAPCDMAEPLQVNLLDAVGCSLLFNYAGGGEFTGMPGCQITLNEQEESGTFALSSNAGEIAFAEIDYWAMPVDSSGMPLTPEIFLEAVLAFVEWRWTKRQKKRKPKEISNADVATAKADWIVLAQQAHGRSKLPPQMEAERLSRGNISRIPNMGRRPINFRR
jgi:hypothetical protein